MIIVYRQAASSGARELAEKLAGRRVRDIVRRPVRAGELLVNWGPPAAHAGRALNGVPIKSKFSDAVKLKESGVATVQVSRERPMLVAVPTNDPLQDYFLRARSLAEILADTEEAVRNVPFRDGIAEMQTALQNLHDTLAHPPHAQPGGPDPAWVGRTNDHVGGIDLLMPPARPDYWVKKEDFVAEYRVHSFLGHSIRAGKKVLRDGVVQPSPWVRSWDGGWKILYDGVSARQAHRDIAHAAIKALGLDFGAVDIGERADGSLVVLEVNRAPGLEGGTIDAYASAIQKWERGEWAWQ